MVGGLSIGENSLPLMQEENLLKNFEIFSKFVIFIFFKSLTKSNSRPTFVFCQGNDKISTESISKLLHISLKWAELLYCTVNTELTCSLFSYLHTVHKSTFDWSLSSYMGITKIQKANHFN